MTYQDPALERLDDALDRVRSLELRANQGEVIAPAELAGEMRAQREDLLSERRDVLVKRAEFAQLLRDLDARKLNRNPNAIKAAWLFAGTVMTVMGGWVLWLVTK